MPVRRVVTLGSSDNSDRVNLDQVPWLRQRLPSDQGVGRLVVTEHRHPGWRDVGQVLGLVVNDIDRDLGHLRRSGSGSGKGMADVGERLAGLGSQVARSDKPALCVVRHLSCDEDQAAAGRGNHLRIGPRRGQRLGIDDPRPPLGNG